MKAETEAFVAIQFWCDDPEGTDDDLRAILSKLARDAEDAAYERAAADCEDEAEIWGEAANYFATEIRSLKSQKAETP